MTIESWLTLLAIVLAPLVAVAISRELERKHARRERQMNVFRDLMRTRRRLLDPIHVSALNLVEIEFFNQANVRRKFSTLMEFINNGLQRREGEAEDEYWNRYAAEHASRLTALLDEMGRSLGYGYQQLEILRGGYNPARFGDIEQQQEKALRLFNEVYDGRRVLPIAVFDYRSPEEITRAAAQSEASRPAENKG